MIAAIPPETPLTIPVDGAAVAIAALLEDHVPPAVALDSVIVDPAHTSDGPVMAAGMACTVTVAVAVVVPQPAVSV